jgi:hypothetical protein
MSSSAGWVAGFTMARLSGSAARGLGPYSIATSWTSSARRFSPALVVYSRAGQVHELVDHGVEDGLAVGAVGELGDAQPRSGNVPCANT